jgi:lysozyme family protein
MANYKKVLDHVKTSEGGYSADPVDNASDYPSDIVGLDRRNPTYPVHTYRGVTYRSWKAYGKKKGFDPTSKSFVSMTYAQWEDLLKTMYWDAIGGDKIKSQGIAEIIFEAVWGGGIRTLVLQLQNFLNVNGAKLDPDGAIGKNTIDALNSATKKEETEKKIIEYLSEKRLKYLQTLTDWWKYKDGWTDRVAKMKAKALQYIIDKPATSGAITLFGFITVSYFLLKN